MPYATPANLLSIGAVELAQLAAPEDNSVTGPLLRLTIEGGDRSEYSAEEQAAADAAVQHLVDELDRSSRIMDGYITPKYPLPLSAKLQANASLDSICVELTHWALTRGAPTTQVAERYDRAMRWLRDLSKGVVSLGEDDSNAAPTGRPSVRPGVSGIDWGTF